MLMFYQVVLTPAVKSSPSHSQIELQEQNKSPQLSFNKARKSHTVSKIMSRFIFGRVPEALSLY